MAAPRRMTVEIGVDEDNGISVEVTVTGDYSPDILDDIAARASSVCRDIEARHAPADKPSN